MQGTRCKQPSCRAFCVHFTLKTLRHLAAKEVFMAIRMKTLPTWLSNSNMISLIKPIDSLPNSVAGLPVEVCSLWHKGIRSHRWLRYSCCAMVGAKQRRSRAHAQVWDWIWSSSPLLPLFRSGFPTLLVLCGFIFYYSPTFQILLSILRSHTLLIDGLEDHSLSHHDCLPYYIRTGDTWVKIDYSKPASHWMKPLVRGSETGLVEIPVNWYLDDLPPMMYMKKVPNSHGWVNAKDVEELWKDHFDYFYREYENFCFPVTIHPDVSGHPHVLLMLERSDWSSLPTSKIFRAASLISSLWMWLF